MVRITMIKNIIFDLDGTLLNSQEGIFTSINNTFEYFGYNKINKSNISKFIGPPVNKSFYDYLGVKGEQLTKMVNYFRSDYKNNNLFNAELYEGTLEVLKFLKQQNFKLGIATYKRYDYAKIVCEKFGLMEFMDIIEGSDYESSKDKNAILLESMVKMNANSSDTIYIGDAVSDYEAAVHNDVKFISVEYGFGDLKELKGENLLGRLRKINDLKVVLENENN